MTGKFGYEPDLTTQVSIEDDARAVKARCQKNGTADSITVRLRVTFGPHNIKCALHDSSGKILQNGVTQVRNIGIQPPTPTTFIFVGTKPVLKADTDYFISVFAEGTLGDAYAYYGVVAGWTMRADSSELYPTYPNPLDMVEWGNYAVSIFCSYTPGPPVPGPPTCRTNDASTVHQNDATLQGTVTHDGNLTCQARFQYGKTAQYGTNTSWQDGKHTNDAISQLISGLAKGTTYHFRLQVQNPHEGSIANGSDKTFTTSTTTRGTLSVSAVSDGEAIKARVGVNGAFYDTPFEVDLEPGSYILNATYQSQTLPPQTVVITAGETTTVTLRFTAMYTLTVLSAPLEEIAFTLDGSDQTTPFEQEMPSGTYTIVMPSSIQIGNDIYSFSQWEDISTNPSRTLSLTRDLTVTATYVKAATVDPLTGIIIPIVDEIEGTGPINQRQMKDVMQEVFGGGKDISEENPLQVYDPKLEVFEHEIEWAADCHCDEVASLAETNLTDGEITPIFPVGSTRVRAILVASIHILNLAANTHHIAFKVQGNRDGGAYEDVLDLSASAQLGLVAVDAATDGWSGAIDVTDLVTTSGVAYNFRFVVDSDNAGQVRYITCFTLVIVYHM